MPPETTSRRFTPPWTIEEHNQACFILSDKNGQGAGLRLPHSTLMALPAQSELFSSDFARIKAEPIRNVDGIFAHAYAARRIVLTGGTP